MYNKITLIEIEQHEDSLTALIEVNGGTAWAEFETELLAKWLKKNEPDTYEHYTIKEIEDYTNSGGGSVRLIKGFRFELLFDSAECLEVVETFLRANESKFCAWGVNLTR